MPSIAEQIELLRLRERNVRSAPTLLVVPRPVERPRGAEEAERAVRIRPEREARAGPAVRGPPPADERSRRWRGRRPGLRPRAPGAATGCIAPRSFPAANPRLRGSRPTRRRR